MPIPAPNLYPPFNIIRLSHVDFGVTDLTASKRFYVDTLGLQITDEDDQTVYLRAMEERGHHCMVLHKSDAAHVKSLSFKVFGYCNLTSGNLSEVCALRRFTGGHAPQ